MCQQHEINEAMDRNSHFINVSGELNLRGTNSDIKRVTKSGPKSVRPMSQAGGGRKRESWVDALHHDLPHEF